MTRNGKIALWVGAGLLGIATAAFGVCLWLSGMFTSYVKKEAHEIPVTPAYAAEMRAAGYPISIQRAFEASAYGGWHGDGSTTTAWRYPPEETGPLLTALKQREPTAVWAESSAGSVSIEPWSGLIPREFLPANDRSRLVVGELRKGYRLVKYAVDPARGTLYCISIQD